MEWSIKDKKWDKLIASGNRRGVPFHLLSWPGLSASSPTDVNFHMATKRLGQILHREVDLYLKSLLHRSNSRTLDPWLTEDVPTLPKRSAASPIWWDSSDWFIHTINPVLSAVAYYRPQCINPTVSPLVVSQPSKLSNECLAVVDENKLQHRRAARQRDGSVGPSFFPTFLLFFYTTLIIINPH